MLTKTQRQFVEVAAPLIVAFTEVNGPVAGYLLGRLEGENRATIEEIVTAAGADQRACSACGGSGTRENRESASGSSPCRCVCSGDRKRACQRHGVHQAVPFDPAALFRAITLEALGQGSVHATFGEIGLILGCAPDPKRCGVCGWLLADSAREGCVVGNCSFRPRPSPTYTERCTATRPLVIPRLVIEGAARA